MFNPFKAYVKFWENLFLRIFYTKRYSEKELIEIIKYKDKQIMELKLKYEHLQKTLQKITDQYLELKEKHSKLIKELIEE